MGSRSTTKLFVGNVKEDCRSSDLRLLFAKYGEVAECDVVKDYAFVHFYNADEAMAALEALDGSDFQGVNLRVQLSHSRVRQKPGMGEKETCYKCGRDGHWSKECKGGPGGRGGPPRAYRGHDDGYSGGPPPGRDYYPHVSSGLPTAGAVPSDRYHPYDRRHAGPPARGFPRSDYSWPDYYSSRAGYPAYYAGADYSGGSYAGSDNLSKREPAHMDSLGRPPPEYYAHRLKDAYYDLAKDSSRAPSSYGAFGRGQTSSSFGQY